MLVSELIEVLKKYIPTLEVKILTSTGTDVEPIAFTQENITVTSETAFIDNKADEDEWDTEDGKIELGDGKQFILINPPVY